MMKLLPKICSRLIAASALVLPTVTEAANWNWNNLTGSWSLGGSWQGGIVPPLNDITTSLTFAGNVGTTVTPTTYTALNDFGGAFTVNRIVLNGIDANPGTSGLNNLITGNTLFFTGTNPGVTMSGSASFAVNTPLHFASNIAVEGNGAGTVTFNGKMSGFGDITKRGTSTMRFGTSPVPPATAAPSENTWMGRLIIEGGTVRFNNNAQSGATAIRANPVMFTGGGVLTIRRDNGDETDGFDTSLRTGTLMGATGSVLATVEGANTSNYDIVVTALVDGTFGGSITLPGPTGTGNDAADLVIRGSATQTLTGTLNINKDVIVGDGATLVLSGNASLSGQTQGAITFAGGNLVLNNTGGNVFNGRLRDATTSSTTVETIGGGMLTLIGNALSGTTELTGRLQLGASSVSGNNNPRSGHLGIHVVHNAGGLAPTELTFQSYIRVQDIITQYATVDFSAANGTGTTLTLGQTGSNPRIRLTNGAFTVPLLNSLLNTTSGSASAGWATVNGTDFASHGANGVVAATTTAWSTVLPASANALVTGNANTPNSASAYTVNSIKIAPTAISQSLNIAGTGHLNSTAFLLVGGMDFLIRSTGGGGISGTGPRFFNVASATLTVDASLAAADQPIVKTGKGTLVLNNPFNATVTAPIAINQGTLRSAAADLPFGEIRLRGGVLEISGGGTFQRDLSYGENSINWAGIQFDPAANGGLGAATEVSNDRGSGGFSAFGADVTVDLNAPGASMLRWEDMGFLRSSYALIFGSPTATHRITFADSINLTSQEPLAADVNYNAREIRVVDNPGTTGDRARITGAISGQVQNDLLKTGAGTLELAGTNTYLGATLIQQGTLLVTGSSTQSFVHQVKSGATLAGNGSVGTVRVEAGGTLAPGMTPDLASIFTTGDLAFLDPTAKLSIGIGGTNAGGNVTTGYDQLVVNGTVSLGGADLEGSLLGGFMPAGTDIFFIILNDGADAVQGTFADGSQITIGGQTFNIFYAANYDTFSLSGGNDVALQLVPEPGSLTLLGLGALLAMRRRRA